jgi:hypothetical protein
MPSVDQEMPEGGPSHPPQGAAFHAASALAAIALTSMPAICAAEKFIYLGAQPDGVEVYVQVSAPATMPDGRRQGWFRTVQKVSQPITDEHGMARQYSNLLAHNIADCAARAMGTSAMIYQDDKQAIVARFEIPPKDLELRKIKANTLGDTMLNWLCAAKRLPSPIVKSPGTDSPFK